MQANAIDVMRSKYLFYIGILFVTVLLISNTVAIKLVALGPLVFDAGTLIFPITYIIGDILTEVYGYRASRKAIWSGFLALILMSFTYLLVDILPSASFWEGGEAYSTILGVVPRIVLGSLVAFAVGEFCNAFILSKLKVMMEGRLLYVRTIGSTIVGQGVDTLIFTLIAFYGTMAMSDLAVVFWSGYIFKVAFEILATPITYAAVRKLKHREGIDVYDTNENYNPFKVS